MASGPWDNVQLAGPPNGPAWVQAAANMMNATQGSINNAVNAYQQGQNFQYQQNQRNFFQDPNNQQVLQQALQSGQYAPLMQALIQQGGTGTASQLLPSLIQQGASQAADQEAWGGKPATPTTPTAVFGITGQNGGQSQGNYATKEEVANNNEPIAENDLSKLARSNNVNLNGFLQRYPNFVPLLDQNLTPSQTNMATAAMAKFSGGSSSRNTVAQSGQGDDESSNRNHLPPSSGEGSSQQSPRQGADRRLSQNTVQPPQQIAQRTTTGLPTEADLKQLEETGDRKLRAAGRYGISKEKAESLRDAGNKDKELAKQLREQRFEVAKPTEMEKNLGSGAARRTEADKAQQARNDALENGMLGAERSSDEMARHLQSMHGILESPNLFTGAGQANTQFLRQAAQNYLPGYNPNTTLPNEALKKVTAQNLQSQLQTLQDEAREVGGTAGRVMLAQIRIMQDAAQNPDSSIPTLRYLTELGDRAVNHTREVTDLMRDYKKQNGSLDGFDQRLSTYNRQHPMLTREEEQNINLVAAPRLPSTVRTAEQAKAWAQQRGLSSGDPIRLNKTYPAEYIHAP